MNRVFDWLRDSGRAEFLTGVLSLLAVLVSIIAFAKSHRTQKRLVEIEEAREQDRVSRSRKAHLTAKIINEEPPRTATSQVHRKRYLVIENAGPVKAKDISILLGRMSILDSGLIENPSEEICEIEPDSSFRYEFRPGLTRHNPLLVTMTWKDESGEPGTYNMRFPV
jgi:hypothetical protein